MMKLKRKLKNCELLLLVTKQYAEEYNKIQNSSLKERNEENKKKKLAIKLEEIKEKQQQNQKELPQGKTLRDDNNTTLFLENEENNGEQQQQNTNKKSRKEEECQEEVNKLTDEELEKIFMERNSRGRPTIKKILALKRWELRKNLMEKISRS